MKIGVLFNHQGAGLAASLRALLPQADIILFRASPHLPAKLATDRAALLGACDHLITLNLGTEHGALATDALRLSPARIFTIPAFTFAGLHPDMCDGGRDLIGPTGRWQSRIAIAAYLAGLPVQDAAALYHRLVFARLGYDRAFAEHSKTLCDTWAHTGIDMAAHLPAWHQTGCFVHAPDRPKIAVLLDIARAICARIGITATETVDPANLVDDLADGPTHPPFAAFAAEASFSPGLTIAGDRITMTLAEFIDGSFARFAACKDADLLGIPGLRQTLTALCLRRVRRPAPRRTAGPAMALLTYHGTVLCAGPSPGQIRHVPLSAADASAPLVLADCTAPDAIQADTRLAHAALRPGSLAPAMNIVLAGAFLCAERDGDAASFNRANPGDWENFLPILPEDAAALRDIAAADWFLPATGETITRGMIRVGDRFRLQFGRWSVDLTRDFPRISRPSTAGPTTLTLTLDGAQTTLRQIPTTEPETPAPATMLQAGRRLVLAGEPAWLPPPVTLCDADRDWVYRTAHDKTALNGRAQPAEAILRRELNQQVGAQGGAILAGSWIRFCEATIDTARAWMDAAIRLHVLTAVAPPDATFLVPPGTPDAILQAWRALGFHDTKMHRLEHAAATAADLIWLDNASPASLPAEALRGLRARLNQPPPPGRKLCWQAGLAPACLAALVEQGFEPIDGDALPIEDQIALLAQAGWVAARSGQVPLAFCQPGTRFIELADEGSFDVEDWMFAVKLGLMHGVVPYAMAGGPEPARLSALLRVLAART